MTPDRQTFKRYLRLYALIVAVVTLPFAVNYAFVVRSYELTRYSDIITEQFRRRGNYDSALNGNDLKYKIELIRRVKPEVVVIGSSRAMNVRELVFTRPFVNAGGVSSNLRESESFVRGMLAAHKPQLAIYFVDYWWFNPRQEQTSNRYRIDETAISFAKLTSPFVWLRQNKISWNLYRDVLLYGHHENANTSFDNLGVFAMRDSSGFRLDGSYFNPVTVMSEKGLLAGYREELEQIRNGQNERVNLGLGDFADEDNVRWFLRTLDVLKQAGVEVIVVLPPVGPQQLAVIAGLSRGAYVSALTRRLAKDVPSLYDFTDFSRVTPDNCEYIDAYHMGDTLSLRLLEAILGRTPDSPLARFVDRQKLSAYVTRYAGRTLIPEDPARYKKPEFDFLGLGCRKPPLA